MSSGIVETGSSKDRDRDKDRSGSQQVPRARLVQKLMAAGADLPAFISALIETQGIVVAGTEAGSKLDKALELGVEIWNEQALLDFLGQHDG